MAGVIGRPIAHSLSPTIHNAAFAAVGLDWAFEAFDVGEGEVAEFLEHAVARRFGGLSVTMPDKGAAAHAVSRLTPDAEALGAVNTVVFDGADTLGDNTDGQGFVDALRVELADVDVTAARVVVVGAGGAARAVVLAMGRAGADEVVVVNRTPARAPAAAALAPGAGRVGVETDIATADIVVNATPLGMGGDADRLPFDPDLLRTGQVVCDLVYWPPATPVMRAATGRGVRAINGLGMLVHQAARAFTLWTGLDAPISAMTAAVRDELARRE